ncbi:hypothetical protein PPERSA_00463 [Pseudocohnilembus persalinus]|uniref:Tetraspanin/Peripherin n=1 Tax=Pseudocohnilembus persalinus TaxID=266149 RepID=A0A0V0QHS8_PSEPJ|nr:hypothetical protein PPERSA_00463 [Pseudocohnilembus persalinus]|eukprot:KRX01841.1 hypothetical protein PPERSA_00463 [Pseudocohnilembus persalinus]
MDSIKKEIYGNSCVFFIFNIFNIFLGLEGLAVLGFGIYLWAEFSKLWIFAATLLGIGFLEFILAYMGWNARKSNAKLLCYVYILGLLFLVQSISTIIVAATKGSVIEKYLVDDKNKEDYEEIKEKLEDHVNIVLYGCISAITIQLLCLLISCWYRSSLNNRRADQYEQLAHDDRKTSLQTKQKEINSKYESKRADYKSKDPNFQTLFY